MCFFSYFFFFLLLFVLFFFFSFLLLLNYSSKNKNWNLGTGAQPLVQGSTLNPAVLFLFHLPIQVSVSLLLLHFYCSFMMPTTAGNV